MSTINLNTLLKQQIREAITVIYDEQGKTHENRYSNPDQLSKALLDLLFPAEGEHNTQVTGVVRVPTVSDLPPSDSESTDSKKERKKRAPMTEEAKAQMKAKREATIAAKAAPPAEEPKSDEPKAEDKKERKARGPMTEEAKAQMKAKREATIAAKKAAV